MILKFLKWTAATAYLYLIVSFFHIQKAATLVDIKINELNDDI